MTAEKLGIIDQICAWPRKKIVVVFRHYQNRTGPAQLLGEDPSSRVASEEVQKPLLGEPAAVLMSVGDCRDR